MDLSTTTNFFRNLEKQVNSGPLTGTLSQEDTQKAYDKLSTESPDLIPREIKDKFKKGLDSDTFDSVDKLGVGDGLINDQELYASLGTDSSFTPWTSADAESNTGAITGETGPNEIDDPKSGNFGRNAALNVQDTPEDELPEADIQYTPSDKPMRADALGYAEEDIKRFDEDGDGGLSLAETQAAFGSSSDTEVADTLFNAINTDGDDQISNLEQAAYVMFQDHSISALNTAVDADEEAGLLTPEDAGEFREQIQAVAPSESEADGKITAEERAFADGMLLSASNLSGQVLEGFQDFISKADSEAS